MRHQRMMHYRRGSVLIEMAISMGIVVTAMFGILFLIRWGVANERAQLAVRYGGLSAWYAQPNPYYSAANIYAFYKDPSASGPATCPSAEAGAFSNSGPFPGPVSAPFWIAQNIQTPPCTMITSTLPSAQFLASHFFFVAQVSATAQVPAFAPFNNTVSATTGFAHPAYPAAILRCTGQLNYNGVYDALFPNVSPPPMPSGNC